jgi:hypothetical protein
MKKETQPSSSAESGKTKKGAGAYLYPALLTLVFLGVYIFIFDSKINLGGDNAGYYVLGKSISSGQGYSNIHMPDNPAHNHFPPGYPAILALFMHISDSISFLKVLNGLFLLASSWILFSVFSAITGNKRMAFVGAAFVLFNFHLLSYSTIMMSEIPFLFFSLLIIYNFIKSVEQANPFKHPHLYLVILFSSFAFHVRTAGIALVGGIILYLLFQKRFKYLISYLVGFILLAIPWFLRGQASGGSSYVNQLFMVNPYRKEEGMVDLGGLFTRFFKNLERYIGKEIPNGIFPGYEVNYQEDVAIGGIFFGLLLIGLMVFGLIKLPKYRNLFIWYCLGTFAILLLWPEVWFGVRFELPLIPFFSFFALYGLYQLLVLFSNKINLQLNPLVLTVLLLFLLPQVKDLSANADARYPSRFKNYFDVADWVGKNTSEDVVVCARKPTLFYLFANRKTVKYAYSLDYSKVLNGLDSNEVDYVVLDALGYSSTGRYLAPVIQGNPERFKTLLQYPNPDTYLLTYDGSLGYKGPWKKSGQYSIKDGKGRFYQKDRYIEGTWMNNELQGVASTHYADGSVMVARYKNGRLVEVLKDPVEDKPAE